MSCLLGVYICAIAAIEVLLLILFCFHIHLVFINQTTYEKLKGLYKKVPLSPNPFDLGGFCRNFWARYRQQKRSDSVLTLLIDIISLQSRQLGSKKLSRIVSEPKPTVNDISHLS